MLREKLEFVYGPQAGKATFEKLQHLIDRYSYLKDRQPVLPPAERLTERDIVLITYGDQLQSQSGSHLQTLHHWLRRHLTGLINTIHILPFYPYTSDDGFSVVDYWQVDPALGTWDDIRALHTDFKLMFDGVINHISASSAWFQGFLQGQPRYQDYFIVTDPAQDLSQVTRPRALPLLTRFQTPSGEKYLWTTFSADQLDLNFRNPEVFLQIAELMLFYASQGADLIRLDAIGYMWKEIGTSCIHLPQTHALVQALRAMLDQCAPNLLLITETNVPHRDNISYFGDGRNEAQLVYQFPLVPLVLHTLQTGHARALSEWAAGLEKLSDTTTFFNFLASHDGIGVVPAKSILKEPEVEALVERTLAYGGQVSYKNNPDGTQSPYELNITYFDALTAPAEYQAHPQRGISRFICSQAVMLAMQGVPGIYFHSLLGSPNWQQGFNQTGRNRTLNREKLGLNELEAALADPDSHPSQIFNRYAALLRQRIARPAFHPNGRQQVVSLEDRDALFILLRTAPDDSEKVLAVHNVSGLSQSMAATAAELGLTGYTPLTDLLSGEVYRLDPDTILMLDLAPYQVMWLHGTAAA